MRKQSANTVRAVSLAVLMICSIIVGGVTFTGSVTADHPDINVSDLEGSGTESDPYVITTAPELQAMEDDLDAYYVLGNDIDASGTAQWNDGAGFDPVGGSRVGSTPPPFTGSLDGSNHTITGLTIDRPSERQIGLFSFSEETASISNLSLTNLRVTGDTFVGGLVGLNFGGITNATASGNVSGEIDVGGLVGASDGGNITEVTSTASVTGNVFVGGLVGDNSNQSNNNGGKIQTAIATGNVSGGSRVGGLVGENSGGTITDATASGDITGEDSVGALVGVNAASFTAPRNGETVTLRGTVRDSFAVGPVDGDSDAGGLVGTNTVSVNSTTGTTASGTIVESYWDTQATGQSDSAGSATGLTTAQMTGEAAQTNMAGLDFETTWQTQPNDYPTLSAIQQQDSTGETGDGDNGGAEDDNGDADGSQQVDVDPSDLPGDGTQSNPYEISNASELQAMEDDLDAHYVFRNDINASGTAEWNNGSGFNPIGSSPNNAFTGTFDAQGNNITGLVINRSSESDIGLFGVNAGDISNVNIVGADIKGDDSVGGLAGTNSGRIIDSSVSGRINGTITGSFNAFTGGIVGLNTDAGTVRNVSASTIIIGNFQVGGLIGLNEGGTVVGSSATGSVNGTDSLVGGLVGHNSGGGKITDSSASNNVTGNNSDIGGLVGENQGPVNSSFATGNVTGNNSVGGLAGSNANVIQNVTASGSVNGNSNVGGLVGNHRRGTVANATVEGNVVGNRTVGGLIGEVNRRSTVSDVLASGNISATSRVGGLVGESLGGTVSDAQATGVVDGSGRDIGGLVGLNNRGTVSNATAYGSVNGSRRVGGLVGLNFGGNVSTAVARGNVTGATNVGGLVGSNDGIITNVSANGSVDGSERVGGLVGINTGGTVSDAFAVGDVRGDGVAVGGLVAEGAANAVTDGYWNINSTGQPTSVGGTGLTTAEMQGETARDNMSGLDFETTWQTQPNDYPTLTAVQQQNSTGETGDGSGGDDGTQVPAIVGDTPAQDLDGDGTFEDVNGDGEFDIVDVNALFQNQNSDAVQDSINAFDFNGDGEFNIVDVNALFQNS